ncbi:uncharacterized protein BXZ73DRAFT_74558 [Epithele typhae]|uniref:uncharacterized protein n=1 Tax=Epithele typhae TaxID=378194 RepID=UPI002008CE29|nr:uncharacterized protein BXZ73DRAFT_74558 [Epithele typhae]KAH9942273.1 hypothetical protein BXZ73DRAFT_74558 [Epithele typhae]
MSSFADTTPFQSNPIETKTQLAESFGPHTSPGGSRIHLGFTGTHYDETAAQLEGFSRPIWGLASLLAGGTPYAGVERWVRGFASGTNPDHEEFWGPMRNKDQRMVECSAIGFSLAVAREHIWDPLPDEGKRHLEEWLGGMNDKEMPNTNWLWFRVFSNLGLSKVGSPRYDASRLKADIDHLDTFYIGEGWSRDGPEGVVQLDYYSSSFAIQFAQLVYSKLAQKEDPVRCEEFRNRARKFALDFVRYFDDEGRAVPFGRSLTYRAAMSSFWGALAFADVEPPAPLTWGVIKGLQLRNLRFWARQPGAYYSDGTFTIGYCYPNLNMTENYNSPGSPYWFCKAFVTLSLPESHPFWASAEEPYPDSLKNSVASLYKPLHIATNLGGHTYILSSGQQCSYPVKQSAAKYGKFAYSAAFGYSVPVGSLTLEEYGADNTLALSDDAAEGWKVRRATEDARFESSADGSTTWLRSNWRPWPDVVVETFLVPPTPAAPLWHLRVHRVRTARALLSAEGGWQVHGQARDGRALEPAAGEAFGTHEGGGEARAASAAGVVGVAELRPRARPSRVGRAMRTDANTNLMVPRAVMPTLMDSHEAGGGDTWLVTGVFGLPSKAGAEGAAPGWEAEWEKRPAIPREIAALME